MHDSLLRLYLLATCGEFGVKCSSTVKQPHSHKWGIILQHSARITVTNSHLLASDNPAPWIVSIQPLTHSWPSLSSPHRLKAVAGSSPYLGRHTRSAPRLGLLHGRPPPRWVSSLGWSPPWAFLLEHILLGLPHPRQDSLRQELSKAGPPQGRSPPWVHPP